MSSVQHNQWSDPAFHALYNRLVCVNKHKSKYFFDSELSLVSSKHKKEDDRVVMKAFTRAIEQQSKVGVIKGIENSSVKELIGQIKDFIEKSQVLKGSCEEKEIQKKLRDLEFVSRFSLKNIQELLKKKSCDFTKQDIEALISCKECVLRDYQAFLTTSLSVGMHYLIDAISIEFEKAGGKVQQSGNLFTLSWEEFGLDDDTWISIGLILYDKHKTCGLEALREQLKGLVHYYPVAKNPPLKLWILYYYILAFSKLYDAFNENTKKAFRLAFTSLENQSITSLFAQLMPVFYQKSMNEGTGDVVFTSLPLTGEVALNNVQAVLERSGIIFTFYKEVSESILTKLEDVFEATNASKTGFLASAILKYSSKKVDFFNLKFKEMLLQLEKDKIKNNLNDFLSNPLPIEEITALVFNCIIPLENEVEELAERVSQLHIEPESKPPVPLKKSKGKSKKKKASKLEKRSVHEGKEGKQEETEKSAVLIKEDTLEAFFEKQEYAEDYAFEHCHEWAVNPRVQSWYKEVPDWFYREPYRHLSLEEKKEEKFLHSFPKIVAICNVKQNPPRKWYSYATQQHNDSYSTMCKVEKIRESKKYFGKLVDTFDSKTGELYHHYLHRRNIDQLFSEYAKNGNFGMQEEEFEKLDEGFHESVEKEAGSFNDENFGLYKIEENEFTTRIFDIVEEIRYTLYRVPAGRV